MYEELTQYKNVPPIVAAKLMDKRPQFVRIGLQRGLLPFGIAVKAKVRYDYYISPERLIKYLKGELK